VVRVTDGQIHIVRDKNGVVCNPGKVPKNFYVNLYFVYRLSLLNGRKIFHKNMLEFYTTVHRQTPSLAVSEVWQRVWMTGV
jgi:hypothetical protein